MSANENNVLNSDETRETCEEITAILKSSLTPIAKRRKLAHYHENDIAQTIVQLSRVMQKTLFLILEDDFLAQCLEYLDEDQQVACIEEMDVIKASSVLSKMDADDMVRILKGLPAEMRDLIIESVDVDIRKDIALLSSFSDSQIGSKMVTNYIEICNDFSVLQAMRSMLEQAKENDNISTIFVRDKDGVYDGAIDLRDLIIARKDTPLSDVIKSAYPYVYGNEKIDSVIEDIKDYGEDSIPVLDTDNRLLGVITAQNLIQVIDDEMAEDYARLAGLKAEEDINEPVMKSVSKRIPWLAILLVLGMIVSSVVGAFEGIVASLPLLMAFQSMVLDMAGNVGTQSLAVTIRIITDETLDFKQKVWLVFKEGRIGFLNGLILGLISFVVVGLYIYLTKNNNIWFAFGTSACIGFAMQIAMLVSAVLGTAIPQIFKSIHIDPAVASGPLITTMSDLTSVCTYYGLCWLILIVILHF